MRSNSTTMAGLRPAMRTHEGGRPEEELPANRILALSPVQRDPAPVLTPCDHRAVSRDGRIICRKITDGDNAISPSRCLACPAAAINCSHLRFSLRQTSPSPLIVRFNGRMEIWGDEPPELQMARAACAEQVIPIDSPLRCASCALRQPVHAPTARAAQPQPRRCAARAGKVVPFARPEPLAASA